MKKMALLLGTCLATAALPTTSKAQTYEYLNITYNNTPTSIALNTLQKITFTGGNMQVFTTGGTKSFALKSTSKLSFSSTPTGIAQTIDNTAKLSWDEKTNTLLINETENGVINIYAANGCQVMCRSFAAGNSSVQLHELSRGLYIVKTNNTTLKIIRK